MLNYQRVDVVIRWPGYGGWFRASIHAGDQIGKTWQNLGAAQETMCVFTGEMRVKPWDGVRFEKRRSIAWQNHAARMIPQFDY
jgi:hypothetical protein